ncbi:MAG: hypothetical protein PWQ24_482 [Mesotoga sp.]|jgi:hypothetical protein|nr:hypothetical protein [Mesotoga sp.]
MGVTQVIFKALRTLLIGLMIVVIVMEVCGC